MQNGSPRPYHRHVLPNGLRVLVVPLPHTRSVTVALYFGTGSRYEAAHEQGIAHLVEHMLFKGSRRYPSAQRISETIEGVGGILNAATDKELTVYYAKVASRHAELAFDLLSDMVQAPLLRAGRAAEGEAGGAGGAGPGPGRPGGVGAPAALRAAVAGAAPGVGDRGHRRHGQRPDPGEPAGLRRPGLRPGQHRPRRRRGRRSRRRRRRGERPLLRRRRPASLLAPRPPAPTANPS